jgi:hypothetical protein
MRNFCIRKGNDIYYFAEIEFYYHSEKHKDIKDNGKDTNVYLRTANVGEWFTHLSGVDIAFESDGKQKYGGILIRSLYNADDEKKSVFGPLKTMIMLFNHTGFDEHDYSKRPFIIPKEGSYIPDVQATTRFNIQGDAKYRFFDGNPAIKWRNTNQNNGAISYYSAKPQNQPSMEN